MKVAHICTKDFLGGAARSANRIHTSLVAQSVNSTLFVRDKQTNNPSVVKLDAQSHPQELKFHAERAKQIAVFEATYQPKVQGGHYFKSDMGREGLSIINAVSDADIVHLHWLSDHFFDYQAFFKDSDLSKPVVWRLPDMNPVTGGCHFSGECQNFQHTCGKCPAIGSTDANDISHTIFMRKLDALSCYRGPIEFVATCEWMKNIIAASTIGKNHPINVIYNSVDTDIFSPANSSSFKQQYGIEEQDPVLMMTAANLSAPRKGAQTFIQALQVMPDQTFSVMLAGNVAPNFTIKQPTHIIGEISDADTMAQAYNAADIVVVPSLQDNLPNVILEALSCGKTIVAANTGGISELIKHGENGYLFSPGNAEELKSILSQLVHSPQQRKKTGELARKFALDTLTLRHEADKYAAIYQRLLGRQ